MKIVSKIELIDKEEWDSFVKNHPFGNVFQTRYMYDVYTNTAYSKPIVLCCYNDQKIVGVLVAVIQTEFTNFFRYFTSRSIIFGGPLVLEESSNIYSMLISFYDELIKKHHILYTQVRNSFSSECLKNVFMNFGYFYEDHLNIIIDIAKSPEDVFQSIKQDRRWEIRKGYKSGILVEEVSTSEQLAIFYSFIKTVYNRIQMPAPKFSLIISTFNNLVLKGMGKFYLIKHNEIYIASHSILLYEDTVTCWYGGLDREYRKLFPYEILIWESIKWGSENNYKYFDFQGAGKPNKDYGVRDFKLRFGGNLVSLGRYEKIHNKLFFLISKIGLALYKKFVRFKNY